METKRPERAKPKQISCARCQALVAARDAHTHGSQPVCEVCYMDIRTPRVRKTHWQYLRSPKTDYLRRGKAARKAFYK